jgi:PAS domain-containing protein
MTVDTERSAKYSNAPDLEDTDERQAALRRYHILDTAPEKDFDRITSLVAKICKVPTALISLIDKERQWFKSCFGFDSRETDIGVSFCVHAVHNGEMLVVEDATKDPRFKDNPIVTGPPNLRFYAGAPLTTPEGIHIGSLCIIDYRPRVFDAAQREILERLADVVVSQFELRSAEAQVRQLVDENPQPMYAYAESDGRIMRSNPAAHAQYGYAADAFDDLHASDLEAPADASNVSGSGMLTVHQRADGSTFPVHLRQIKVLLDGKAAVLAVPRRMPLHDEAGTVFWIDHEGTIRSVAASTGHESLLPESAIGTSLVDLVDSLDRSTVEAMLDSVFNGTQDTSLREITLRVDGSPQPLHLHLHAMGNSQGKRMGATGALTPSAKTRQSAKVTPDREETLSPSSSGEKSSAEKSSAEKSSAEKSSDEEASDEDVHGEEMHDGEASHEATSDASDSPDPFADDPAAGEVDDAPEAAANEADAVAGEGAPDEAELGQETASKEEPTGEEPTGEEPTGEEPTGEETDGDATDAEPSSQESPQEAAGAEKAPAASPDPTSGSKQVPEGDLLSGLRSVMEKARGSTRKNGDGGSSE